MRQCIVIADRARGRLFSVEERKDTPFDEGHLHLVEHRDLVSPEGELTDRDTRAGRRSRSSVGGGGYGIEGGKGRQRDESARRFAKDLVDATSELVRTRKPQRLLLVASPRFLGVIRPAMKRAIQDIELMALAEDLSWHAPAQIEKVLTRRGALDSRGPDSKRTLSAKQARRRRRAEGKVESRRSP